MKRMSCYSIEPPRTFSLESGEIFFEDPYCSYLASIDITFPGSLQKIRDMAKRLESFDPEVSVGIVTDNEFGYSTILVLFSVLNPETVKEAINQALRNGFSSYMSNEDSYSLAYSSIQDTGRVRSEFTNS